MNRMAILCGAMALTACGGGISGEYGGEQCIYDKLTFEGGGKLMFTVMGMEMPGNYEVDGDKVIIRAPNGAAMAFTRDGDTLDGGSVGRCKKL